MHLYMSIRLIGGVTEWHIYIKCTMIDDKTNQIINPLKYRMLNSCISVFMRNLITFSEGQGSTSPYYRSP